ncbi:SIS domain-containing protein [Flavilitoribacter nigricans]|uniref:Sugar isomerase n=1 Tax=Flavilitoribacter nigricans (strain ATCC 23147 / DSM 23189 / NBRC 102662 / NCIMB 1420 / SS-2) TaxID=1122177 RepID=A0A2D0N1N6_FLAN2|nr:SIS domain-containing protein [Flavilitoribacter nigricans]PHN02049.1 sugar isomerase [Flavilitoribacter nigricans DSM 23189 = NBRC 102662]
MSKQAAGEHTRCEIFGQPDLWQSVYQLILAQETDLQLFLTPLLQRADLQILLTGAGSSAFIGEAAQGIVQENTGIPTRAVATTDLVTYPTHYLQAHHPTLLVSFARSGNSPESAQAVILANKHCRELYHLVITCNGEGQLLKKVSFDPRNAFCLVLPDAANDKSLAMTGSFTSMLLSILLLSDFRNIRANEARVDCIIAQANRILDRRKNIRLLGEADYERVVFLGSGPMLAIARECHLKLQELTDGKIICKHDSFLGFRHGPMAVVNAKTLLVYLFSEDQHVFQYERDLAREVMRSDRIMGTVHLGRHLPGDPHERLNIDLDPGSKGLNVIPATLIGQLLGFYKSLALDLDPDNPSISGTINRVVKGVILYENRPNYTDTP